jgi:ribA/ribD-fused uncharacterized protein
MPQHEPITRFVGIYAAFSNFFPRPIVLDGVRYPSSEHAYQAMKTDNINERMAIIEASTPGKAKRLGHTVSVIPDWDEVKLPWMRKVVLAKFTQHPDLMDLLHDTAPAELIEGNSWHDNVWGICVCHKCYLQGQNWLGKILMEIRDTQL